MRKAGKWVAATLSDVVLVCAGIAFLRLIENSVWWLSASREMGAAAWVIFFVGVALVYTLWPVRQAAKAALEEVESDG